jgi:hypothetical protein
LTKPGGKEAREVRQGKVDRLVGGLVFMVLLFSATNAWAVSSSLWESESKADFDAGETEGVSIMPPGRVELGPKTREIDIDALFAWSLAEDSKGNVYVGTGSDGKIFRIPAKGEAEVFAEPKLQQVFALAVGRKDVLYAGGFPGGKIYSIDAKGAVSEYFDTAQDSVWALCARADGSLVVGTGDEGQIFTIEAGGEGKLLYDSPERRILSLLCDADGVIHAGSEQNGIIYRIDKDGRPFVLYDTELEEVTSMIMDDEGALYAVSAPGDLFAKIPPRQAPSMPQAAGAGIAGGPHAAAPKGGGGGAPVMPALPSGKKRACIIYKIAKDGTAEKLWKSPNKLIFSLAFDGTNILAGSGDEGVVYLITPTGEETKYFKVDQKQALDLLRASDGRVVVASGNEAAVTILGGGRAAEGVFTSRVHDATSVSKWGRIFWGADTPSQTSVAVSTRSGNSEQPDDTWSEWSRERGDAEGFTADSPVARFVQWRARLKTSNPKKTPVLERVTMAYLQKNLAPTVKSVSVNGANGKNSGAGAASKPKPAPADKSSGAGAQASKDGVKKAPAKHKTKVKIVWKASDANGDSLEYELLFKGVEEKNWKLIEDDLTAKSHEWDTEAVPDGEYHVRIIASDAPDNPRPGALTDERVSEPFTVDNTSPTVAALRSSRERGEGAHKITGTVSDNLSPVRSAEYSVDAGDWIKVFPADGIFDSDSEKVEFRIERLEKGEHTIVLKAVDYFGNVGAGKITFEVK